MTSPLLKPLTLGALNLRNSIVMAPLTRARGTGTDNRTPNDLMAEYYEQRASAGLILTEATAVTPMGVGYAKTPGIWSDEQTEGWKKITSRVHAKGGLIVLQLWHVGRISHSMFLNGEQPVAPSAIKPAGRVSLVRPETEYPMPRALETSEIPGIVEAYRKGAENAKRAGFDGVELHSANGYLLDQFLQDSTNKRTDQYGGSIQNRARLLLEVTDAVISVFGASRVGVHLAPRGDSHDMKDSNPKALFGYVAEELGKRKIAFIFTREYLNDDSITFDIKKKFGGPVIGNEKLSVPQAEELLLTGRVDAISFGKAYIANPDLVERVAAGAALNELVPQTIYAEGGIGYTDYPFMKKS
ncbi:alkene reductase [Bdellovibrio sp. qaytius]|nr:alkene reductase [Bdellovibrio sp. qaytius]